MVLNLTFIILFFLCWIAMWLGAIFSFTWNRLLSVRRAWVSLLICAGLALLMSGIFTFIIGGMGMLWEITL